MDYCCYFWWCEYGIFELCRCFFVGSEILCAVLWLVLYIG